MSNLKDELNKMETPKNLRAHVRRGIRRAEAEQKEKKQWLPKFLTVAISMAVLLFVAIMVMDVQQERTASVEVEPYTSNLYVMAGLVTSGICVLALWLRRARPAWKRWVYVGMLISIVWVWNVAYYGMHQLNDRIIAPLYVEVLKGEENELRVQYVVDHREENKRIIEVSIGGARFFVENEMVLSEFSHQLMKEAYIPIVASQWERLIREQNSSTSYVVFNDGQRFQLPIEYLAFKTDAKGEVYEAEQVMWPNSNGVGGNGYSFALFPLDDETEIQAIHYPIFSGLVESYELRAGSKVIKRVNANGLEDVDLLPYTLSNEEMIQLDFWQHRTREEFTVYDLRIVIEGEKQSYMYPFLLNWFTLPKDIADLKQEVPQNE